MMRRFRLTDRPDAPRLGRGLPPPVTGVPIALLAGLGGIALLAASRLAQRRRALRALDELYGKTVIITGGARGLGLLLAKEFGRWGARVFLVSHSLAEVAHAEAELLAVGCDAIGIAADLRDPEAVEALTQQVIAVTGRIDVLVNNAGSVQALPVEHTRVEDFADALHTHFWAPLHCIREVLPHMRRQGSGRLVNVVSIGGRIVVPHRLPDSASTFALVGLSEGLCADLRKDGISVTTVCPAPITSNSATRAARRIVQASLARRSRVTIGWQARAAEVLNAVAPELLRPRNLTRRVKFRGSQVSVAGRGPRGPEARK